MTASETRMTDEEIDRAEADFKGNVFCAGGDKERFMRICKQAKLDNIPAATDIRTDEAIARDGDGYRLQETMDYLAAITSAKTNGEALGALMSFRYKTRLDALQARRANVSPWVSVERMTKKSLADRIFDGGMAQSQLEDALSNAGVQFEDSTWDAYDCSLELKEVPAEHRLSAEAQKIIRDAGFGKVYVNHADKWETHYTFYGDKVIDGWRVSYPYRRNDGCKEIWVEKTVPTWPQEWFDSGYAVIKSAHLATQPTEKSSREDEGEGGSDA